MTMQKRYVALSSPVTCASNSHARLTFMKKPELLPILSSRICSNGIASTADFCTAPRDFEIG
jgi:hypothetical protein